MWEIKIHALNMSHLTINRGFQPLNPSKDIEVFRRNEGHERQVLIPGTSVKGALRALATRIGSHFSSDPTHPICSGIRPDELCGSCIVCKLFGAPNVASPLRFRDARPTSEITASDLNTLSGVQINSCTKTVREKGLFFLEAVVPLKHFDFLIHYRGGNTDLLQFFLQVLQFFPVARFGNRGTSFLIDQITVQPTHQTDVPPGITTTVQSITQIQKEGGLFWHLPTR